MTRSTTAIIALLAAMLGPSAGFAAQRTYDRQIEAPPGGSLTFTTDVGSVTVVGRDTSEVIVHAQLRGPESLLDHLRITAGRTSSGVSIAARSSSGWGGWGDWFHWFHSDSQRVRFTVEVPRGYPVDLRTAGGDIHVSDLSASVRAASSGGGALLQRVSGTVNVRTSGGSIDAEHLGGEATLSTSGGGISVSDATGDLDLETSGGGIRLRNDDGKIQASTSGGSIHAQLQANRGISMSTSGGAITLLLPQSMHASIEAESDGGGITSEFPFSATEIASSDHLVAAVGGGGPPISLHSSGGGIRIAPAR